MTGVKRGLIAALTALTLTGLAGGLPEASGDDRLADSQARPSRSANRGPCDEERWLHITPREWTPQLVKGLIRCAVRRWPVSGGADFAVRVAECESSLYPWAYANRNAGVFQHRIDYWVGRVDRYLRPQWFNQRQWERLHELPRGAFHTRANVLISIRMAHAGGWGPWSCA